MTHLPSLSRHGLWDVFLCEPLNYNHSRRKTEPCPSSDPRIAASFICDATFTEEERVRADLPCVCPLPCPQGPPRVSGREMEHCSGSLARGVALAKHWTPEHISLVSFRGDQPQLFKT